MDAARRAAGAARAASLRARLAEAARLVRRAGGQRVVLFGSLAASGEPHPGSDVDLAVGGLPPGQLFEVQADLMELFGVPVDLVRIEDAPDSLVDRIDAEGEEL
ncbi:nucleotidyltransferase family protein [Vulgatibacter sp.]|uniref:nucleotidyltransferase family protein n=1 Tax=Vulgatibacter sp. TaxID=1971226 RepID=UPI003567A8BC